MSNNAEQPARVVNIVVPVTVGQGLSNDEVRTYIASMMHSGEQAAIGQGSREYWEEDPDHPADDWRYAVTNGDTRQGYWEWVGAQKAEAAMEADLPEPKGAVAIGDVVEAVPPKAIIVADIETYASNWPVYKDGLADVDVFDFKEFREAFEAEGLENAEGVSPDLRELALKHGIPFGNAAEYLPEMMGLLKEGPMPCRAYDLWDLADDNGWTMAHQAAKYGHLPEQYFFGWNLRDNNGVSVREVADEFTRKNTPKMGM